MNQPIIQPYYLKNRGYQYNEQNSNKVIKSINYCTRYTPYYTLIDDNLGQIKIDNKDYLQYSLFNTITTQSSVLQQYRKLDENGNVTNKLSIRKMPYGICKLSDLSEILIKSNGITLIKDFEHIQLANNFIIDKEDINDIKVLLSLVIENDYYEDLYYILDDFNNEEIMERLDRNKVFLLISPEFSTNTKYTKLYQEIVENYLPLFFNNNIDVIYTSNLREKLFVYPEINPKFNTIDEIKKYLDNLNYLIYEDKPDEIYNPSLLIGNNSEEVAIDSTQPIFEGLYGQMQRAAHIHEFNPNQSIEELFDGFGIESESERQEILRNTEEEVGEYVMINEEETNNVVLNEFRVITDNQIDNELTEEGNEFLNRMNQLREEDISQILNTGIQALNQENARQEQDSTTIEYEDLPF